MTSDLWISDLAKAADFFCSDGIIVTGSETGQPANTRDLKAVREVTRLPLIVGSGVTEGNLNEYYGTVEAMIVGSHFKVGGHWQGNLQEDRVRCFMEKHRECAAS